MTATLKRRTTAKGNLEPVIHNNTPWTLEQVKNFPRYGGFMNYWRGRLVSVHQPPPDWIQEHPDQPSVVTVGVNFGTDCWICLEPFSVYESRILNSDWSDYR